MELVTALHTVLFCEVGIFFFFLFPGFVCFWAWGGQCVGDILLFFFFEQAFVSGCTMKLAEME